MAAAADERRHAFQEELEVAEAAARAASDIILSARPNVLAQQHAVRQKAGGEGPVTEADIAADRCIREHIHRSFPDDHVVTEESFSDVAELPTSGRVWMVDPLDGTKCFIDRDSTDFCVMIGFCIDGSPVMGVIMEPSTGKLWKGVHTGEGGWCRAWRVGSDGVTAELSMLGALGGTLRFAAAPPVNPRFAPLVSNMVMSAACVTKGSAGLKAMLIVDGTADMYTSSFHKISVWDVCAAHAIVRAVGGNLLTLQLTPLDYGRRNLRDGLFFHHPGLDAPLRQKVKAMYEFLSAHYRAERERKAIK